ncbi:MAG TPA: TlpA family protein disulfide reductase [Bacteroidetes bacterium]|nr:TlpA family protein disulfide reductase [Bacteroidota bacterium]
MKQFHTYLTLSCALFVASMLQAQHLSISPEKPVPGEKTMLTYDPAGTPLEGQQALEVTAYFFENDQPPVAQEVEMTLQDGKFTGQLTTTADTKATALSIKSSDGKTSDNRNNKGYKFLCYKPGRSAPVAGAYAAKAMIYGKYGQFANIDPNREKALNLCKKEFRTQPSSKADPAYFGFYARLAKRLSDEAALGEITTEMNRISKDRTANEKQLILGIRLASILENKEAATALKKKILEKYPNGEMAQGEMRNSFRKAEGLDKQLEILAAYKTKFGATEQGKTDLDNFASSIALQFAEAKNWEKFDAYLSEISDPVGRAGVLNNIAWGMSGESIEAEAPMAEKGERYSLQSLELLEKEMATAANKPRHLTKKQWKERLQNIYAMYADTYALLAYHTGNMEDALKYQGIACGQGEFEDADMNSRYAVYFEKTKSTAETEKMLADLIAKGAATPAMKDRHKKLFLANNTLESAYGKYLAELERAAIEKLRKKVEEGMVEEDAIGFELTSLDGKNVSLESLKGKVVVLDFWATWCGPCKASFPAMQTAVDKYKDRDDVAFVFIDTWERVKNKKENAAKFISDKGYSFNVLLDTENAAVGAYGVEGIPAKFVLDKNGKIRFKSLGYGGNADELVHELSMMIEMAGGGSAEGMSSMP